MCFEENRLVLIESLTQAFKPVITSKNTTKLHEESFYQRPVHGSKEGDVELYFDATAKFKPFDGANFAKISFNLILEGCTLNPVTGLYEWDNDVFKVAYDFEYNLMFCRIDDELEIKDIKTEKLEWVPQTFEQNFSDDKKISWNVLDSIFGAMSEGEFKALAIAAYKAACGSGAGMNPSVDLLTAV